MAHSFYPLVKIGFSVLIIASFQSCSKEDPAPAAPVDPCAGKTIVVSAVAVSTNGCDTKGSITVNASGSTGFTYKLNSGGTYQASKVFNNVTAGTYTVFAKDAAGCEKSTTTLVSIRDAGPKFTEVRNLMTVKCQPCHNNTVQNGGMNFEVDCNIVANQVRIKVRAVDLGTMPQGGPELTVAEKAKITDWMNAGGRLVD